MFGSLLTCLAVCLGSASASELRVKELPLSLTVPDGRWQWNVSQADSIDLWGSVRGLPRFHVEHFQTPQPDPEVVNLEQFKDLLTHQFTSEGRLDQIQVEPRAVEGLGTTMLVTGRQHFGPSQVDVRMVVVPDARGLVALYGADLVGSPGLARRMDELLAGLHLDHPPIPRDQLPYGHVTLPAGYELDLPDHWRMLTADEAPGDARELIEGGQHNRQVGQATFVDTRTLMSDDDQLHTFVCRAMYSPTEPLQPLEPAHDPVAASNLLARLTVLIGGGTLQHGEGWTGDVLSWHVRGDGAVVDVGETDPQSVTIEKLTDRPAFRWQGPGTWMGSKVSVGAWLTSWDDLELYCVGIFPAEESSGLAEFDQAIRSLRVTDAEHHPMYVSLRTRYINWWPWSHPLLQIYILPAYVILPLFGMLLWWSRGSSKPISIRG